MKENSYKLQEFAFELLTRSETSFVDEGEKVKILKKL